LPSKITWSPTQYIEFIYDATGKKWRKIVTIGTAKTVYDYFDGIEYKNGALSAIYHAEGRVVKEATGYVYEYTLRDHLGNGRVYFTDKLKDNIINDNDILQDQTYYAFGSEIDYSNYTTAIDINKYQYNGKELNDDFGLNLSDYGARWYDAAIGRWLSPDPLAEKYRRWSPYNYTMNNPIRFIDPDGMQVDIVNPVDKKSQQAYDDYKKSASSEIKKELAELEASSVIYNVSVSDKHEGGRTAYDTETGQINITVQDVGEFTVGILADELKTASQFENQEYGYDKNTGLVKAYDLEDEIDTKNAAAEALATKGLKLKDASGGELSKKYGQLLEDTSGKPSNEAIEKWSKTKHSIENISYNDIFKSSGGSTKMGERTKPSKKVVTGPNTFKN
jgi:RHS repeat-associated protein